MSRPSCESALFLIGLLSGCAAYVQFDYIGEKMSGGTHFENDNREFCRECCWCRYCHSYKTCGGCASNSAHPSNWGSEAHVCPCTPGWSGRYCRESNMKCLPGVCKSGECIEGGNSISCSCYSGWSGSTCNESAVKCDTNSCSGAHNICEENGNDPVSCICTAADTVGPACEYSNSKTCNDAGTAQPDGSCVCDGPATGLGPTCSEFSNSKTCNDAGTAQPDGSCVCDGPATGLGPTCSEFSNNKTCYSVGVVNATGQCACNPRYVGNFCQFSDAANCNSQATFNPDNGTCSQPCNTDGYKGSHCDECYSTYTLVGNGTIPRIRSCWDPQDQTTCRNPVDVLRVSCVTDIKPCARGERFLNGNCVLCGANTYADGKRSDGSYDAGIRAICQRCPPNALTREPKVQGATSIHECVAECDSGQRSQDGVCVDCAANTFSDGNDANGASDGGYRTTCKPCPDGEISEPKAAVCFAKFQKVANQRFCYGKGTDSQALTATDNVDEFVYAFSRVGAGDQEPWVACREAQELTPGLASATFIPPSNLTCSTEQATAADCAAAFARAESVGLTNAGFCNYPTLVGGRGGYPSQLCRGHYTCAGADTGSCWPPEIRDNTPYPVGCIYNKQDNTVLYYTHDDAKLYYNGFEYDAVCERYVCPENLEGEFEKPVPLKEEEFDSDVDHTNNVPKCRLSSRGIEQKNADATKRNNTVFIPIAVSISVVCMLLAAYITRDDLQWTWITFGVGLRTFDMQTDWGFFSISLKDLGFQTLALYGDETTEGYNYDALLADGDLLSKSQLDRMVHTCLAFCILGTLMTPFDIIGNLKRTEGQHSFAMLISIVILFFEDVPQLYLQIKYTGIMGFGDEIAVLSLVASVLNILYVVGQLLLEFCNGESPLKDL